MSDPLTLTGAGPGSTVITGSHQAGPTAPARAGAINSTADLTVMRLSISGNVATTDDPSTESVADGAGAIVQFAGTLALVDTVIAGNQLQTGATDGAGGVMVDGGVLSMVASTITGNSAAGSGTELAGGADINLPPLGGASSIDSSTVAGNSIGTAVVGLGAGGVLVNGGAANAVNATISANSASPSAATLSAGGVATNGSLTITNSTVAANTGSGAARGNVFVSGTGTHSLRNAIISDGVAPIGSNCAGTFASVGGNIESANQCASTPRWGISRTQTLCWDRSRTTVAPRQRARSAPVVQRSTGRAPRSVPPPISADSPAPKGRAATSARSSLGRP